jgi:hypothetical protein
MSRKLEELFDMNPSVRNNHIVQYEEESEILSNIESNIDKIEAALPQVRGLEACDAEMDTLASMAIDGYKDLWELGMQVEAKYSSEIFNSASSLLGHAITARTAKVNKKLKMLELQLKKAQLDNKTSKEQTNLDNIPLGEGKSLDRNALLKILNEKPT